MIHEHKLRKSVAFSLNMVTFRAGFLLHFTRLFVTLRSETAKFFDLKVQSVAQILVLGIKNK